MADSVPIPKAATKGDPLGSVKQRDLWSFSPFTEKRHGAVETLHEMKSRSSSGGSKRPACFSKVWEF